MRRVAVLASVAIIGLIPPHNCDIQAQLNPEHTFTVREENGVRIVRSGGGPKYFGEIFRYERILVLQEDPTKLESLIGTATEASLMGDDGSIFIRDFRPARIMRFSSDGMYLNDIGRMGQGPGEFESPALLSVMGNKVTIFDPYRSRISIFHYDGRLIEMISTPAVRRRLSFRAAWPFPEGGFLLVDNQTRPPSTIPDYEYELLVATLFSDDQDTLATINVGPVKGSYCYSRGYSAGRVFGGSPNIEYHPERGIYTTTGIEPIITIYDRSGRVVQIIDAGIPPESVNREERRTVSEGLKKDLDLQHADIEVRRGRLDHTELCDPKAFWNDLVVDEYGYLWTELPNDYYYLFYFLQNPPFIGYNHRQFRVFSPEGEYLGITQVPTRGTLSRGHFIALQDNKETGGIDVVLYRIEPAVTGLRFPE